MTNSGSTSRTGTFLARIDRAAEPPASWDRMDPDDLIRNLRKMRIIKGVQLHWVLLGWPRNVDVSLAPHADDRTFNPCWKHENQAIDWEEGLVDRPARRVRNEAYWRIWGQCFRARRSNGERRRHPRRDFHRRHGHELDLLDEQILCQSFHDFEEETEVGYPHLIEDADELYFYDGGLDEGLAELETLKQRYWLDVAEKDLEWQGSMRAEEAYWSTIYPEDECLELPPELDVEQRHRDGLERMQGI